MSIFISPQDYTISANECIKITHTICGCNYSFWCKKEKENQARELLDKISLLTEKSQKKHQNIPADKLLVITMTEYLAKLEDEKLAKWQDDENQTTQNQDNTEIISQYNQIKQELEQNKALLKKEQNKNIQIQKKHQETLLKLKTILDSVKDKLIQNDNTSNKETNENNTATINK